MKILSKCIGPVQSHAQRDLWLAIIGMETKERDLDSYPNRLRMPWLTRLIVVKSQERTDFKLRKRRVIIPQSMNQKTSPRKKSALITSPFLELTEL